MNVEIPQAPAVRTTDNVFIAGPLDSCSLCDVSPGAFVICTYIYIFVCVCVYTWTENIRPRPINPPPSIGSYPITGLTGSNFDGAGLGSCTVAEDCDTLNAAEQARTSWGEGRVCVYLWIHHA